MCFSDLVRSCAACLVVSLAACGGAAVDVAPVDAAPHASQETITPPAVVKTDNAPDVLKIRLTLGARSDLRVREGQAVSAGSVLADRTAERERLTAQRALLLLAMRGVAASMPQPSHVSELPPVSYAEANARIRRAEAHATNAIGEVAARNEAVARQKSVVEAVGALPDLPPVAVQHEAARLQARQTEAAAAALRAGESRAEIDLARAQLVTEQNRRAFVERERAEQMRLEAVRLAERRQSAEAQKAEMIARLATLDAELQKMSVVRSPFAGTIQRIVWEGMNDHEMQVVVWLRVGVVNAGSERGGSSPK